MKTIHYIIYIALAAIFFTACQEEDFSSGIKGGIRISLTEEIGTDVSTRSTPAELTIPIEKDFTIEVKNKAGDTKYSGKLTEDKVIPLEVGSYDVRAYYGKDVSLALDAPYYEGTAENINVKEGYTTPVTLTCKVANALLSIQINEDDKKKFDEAFKTPSFQLTVGGKSVATSDITKSFYFKAGSTISKLAFSKDGSDYQDLEIKNWPKEIKAADHIIVTVGIEPAPSGITLTVEKVKVQTVTIEETIPMEWLPKPSVSATGFDTNNSLTFAETETKEAKLDLKLASALQDIKFKFNFEDEQFFLDKEKEYVWSNEEDKKVISEQLGINVSDKSVDLNGLLAKLQTNAGATTTNTIEVDVKANNRWSSEDETANRTYTITCNKPVFKVDAYPGNIWTKEFTMNALREEQVESGDFTKLSGDMTYQYSADGQTGWTNLSDGMRQDQLQPGTTYYIRGLYRDAVPGEVTEVSTYPVIPLENGDMEYWTEEERGYYYDANIFNSNDPKLRVYYPWNSESFWNTNNNFTTRNRDASTAAFSIVYRYNSFPAVSYTKDANSGTWAAELRNTAAGRGNVSSSESSYEFNNVPGELFIGDISVSEGGTEIIPDDSYSINKGRAFVSRPTALRFYYKYAPYNTDSWKVYIALYDSDDNIIAENTVTGGSQSSYKNIDVPFNYTDDMNVVPAKIYVYFASSIYSGNQLPYHKMNVTTWYKDSQRTDETLSGSVFTIDDIQLIYDK